MKLNTEGVWRASKDHLRILTSIERLTRNHLNIPIELIKKISNSKCNFTNILTDLCKQKFIRYEQDGYRLTFSGYDCLAINALRKRGLTVMGDKIGVGKEADIYYGIYDGKECVLKFHRLGRTSFKTVKKNRNYHEKQNFCSWMTLSKLSCQRETEFLEKFKDLCVPKLFESNRHVVVMEFLKDFVPLNTVNVVENLDFVYSSMVNFIVDIYKLGFVHGDFNEFNILINGNGEIKVIDFPQCLPLSDEKANSYLKRDYECVNTFFEKRFRFLTKCEEIEILISNYNLKNVVDEIIEIK